jgi:hypothetical protein
MGFIAHKEKNFERYLENHFGIVLPRSVKLFYSDGVRVSNVEVQKSDIHGDKGYAACDAGFHPTNSFIQNFGYLATKNVVELDESRAKEFAVGRGIGRIDLGGKNRHVIVKYGEFVLGLGHYDVEKKKITNFVPEKRRRKIINSL